MTRISILIVFLIVGSVSFVNAQDHNMMGCKKNMPMMKSGEMGDMKGNMDMGQNMMGMCPMCSRMMGNMMSGSMMQDGMMGNMMKDPLMKASMLTHLLPMMKEPLELTEKQVKDFKDLQQKLMTAQQAKQTEIQDQQKKLDELLTADKSDLDEIDSALRKIARLRSETQFARYKTSVQMKENLTDNQRKKLSEMSHQQMHQQMMQTMPMMDMMTMMHEMHGGMMQGMKCGGMMMQGDQGTDGGQESHH